MTERLPGRIPNAHIFSVDVEEYFQVRVFDGIVDRAEWTRYPSRVEGAVDELLELLARSRSSGTFFTLGWIAEHRPQVVRSVVEAGHEIASHGFWHRRIPILTPSEFRDDVRRAKAAIEDVAGREVVGFRAPNFSIIPGCEWALEILVEEGHTYDSSRFPIRRPGYGSPAVPPWPHVVHTQAGPLLEVPLTTARFLGMRIPAAGGNYLRQLPLSLIRRGFRQASEESRTGMFYVHPWELDPDQPRLPAGMLDRIRHYRGLAATSGKIERLLGEFRFVSVAEAYPDYAARNANPDRSALS